MDIIPTYCISNSYLVIAWVNNKLYTVDDPGNGLCYSHYDPAGSVY